MTQVNRAILSLLGRLPLCLIQIDCLLPLHISLLAELPIFILGEQKLFKKGEGI